MPVRYKDLVTRIVMSAISGFLIVINGPHRSTFLQLMVHHNFPYAMISSFLIALMAISLVRYVSIKLDLRVPWAIDLRARIIAQILFGIILVMLAVIIVVGIYYAGMGLFTRERKPLWLFNTTWFQVNGLPVLFMIVTANVYYYFYHNIVQQARLKREADQTVKQQVQGSLSNDLFYGQSFADIVYIHSKRNEQLAYLKDGRDLPWKYGIEKGFDLLPTGEYMIANRSEIFRFDNILKTEYVNVERTLMKVYLKVPANRTVEVSRDNTSANRAILKARL